MSHKKTAESRPQVFYVWNYVEWGGAQIHLISIMKYARELWDITVLLPRGSSSDIIGFLTSAGVKIDFLEHKLDLAQATSVIEKIRRQLTRVRSEFEILNYFRKVGSKLFVVHIETAPWQSWQLLSLLRALGGKVFVTSHNTLVDGAFWRRWLWKGRLRFLLATGSLRLFAANRDTLERLAQWVPKKYLEFIPVTYTSIDPAEIADAKMLTDERQGIREKFGFSETETVVLCVGQFIDRKGRWIFLEAAQQIVLTEEKMRFVWLTPELPSDAIQKRVADHDLGDSFRFVKSSMAGGDRIDVLKFYHIADIFALPSYLEGLPISLLEAMALGLPCISTNINSIPEAVIHMKTGVLIEPGDAGALADAIIRLANDPKLRSELSKNAKELVLEKFDERIAADTVLSAYADALDPDA
ncbi:MAG: glycosyltransferase family 4 protein [Acidobacteriota bacterium]|nr:MAG: glycosyltransferase family 4 protein [Acidobacteriota bacterium]